MPIEFRCDCGQMLRARDDQAGQRVRCSACDRVGTVPDGRKNASTDDLAAPRPSWTEMKKVRSNPNVDPDADEDAAHPPDRSGTSGKAVASLVLGVLSFFCFLFAGVPAVVLGALGLRDINKSRGKLSGQGLAVAGIVTGSVGTLLSGLLIIPLIGLLPAVQKVRSAASTAGSANNLKQIGLALHNYHDTYGSLPSVAVGAPNAPQARKAGLSWRVALLPYIEEDTLYRRFRMDEPWDSPNNLSLLGFMPRTYRHPAAITPPDHTHYRVFVKRGAGPGLAPALLENPWDGNRPLLGMRDGLANTLVVVEAADAVPWTKPDELTFDPNQSLPRLGVNASDDFNILLLDGAVRRVSQKRLGEATLRALITSNGGEPLPPDW